MSSSTDKGCRAQMGGAHVWRKANKASGGATYCVNCLAIKGTSSPEQPKED